MGWNSWNYFADKIDDATVRAEADLMAVNGMRDAGYVYVNIDDTWQGTRDAHGIIHPNSRFPDMKALADYVHAKGLKLGIYSSPGPKTCAGYEGSYGHETQDADTYAAWGIDYLKYDLCSMGEMMIATHSMDAAQAMQIAAYKKMGDALRATGRPIVYSLCQYGVGDVWRWGPSVGANLWRTTGDISDSYERMMFIGLEQMGLSKFSHPGGWNDPDMLEIGNGGMTEDESRTHMSLWAISCGAASGWKRSHEDDAADACHPHQPRSHRDRSGRAGPTGRQDLRRRPIADLGAAAGERRRSSGIVQSVRRCRPILNFPTKTSWSARATNTARNLGRARHQARRRCIQDARRSAWRRPPAA